MGASTILTRTQELRAALARVPQAPLAFLPTPLERLPRASKYLGIDLYIKRDDQTGLALGGNKTRKLAYILGEAIAQGADTIVTWAGVQSNWCRQLAAAARKLGLRCVLVLFRRAALPSEIDGNLFLDALLGADIRLFDMEPGRSMGDYETLRDIIDPIVEEQRAAGHRPYVAPLGGSLPCASMSQPVGAWGYVEAMTEIAEQADSFADRPISIVHANGSGGTHGGLLAGAKAVLPQAEIVGISVSDDRETTARWVLPIARGALSALGQTADVREDDVIVFDEYVGPGYGLVDGRTAEAVGCMARWEGILLDPVYTGKALAGLIDLAEKGHFSKDSAVIFLHTGGTPALFPYRDVLRRHLDLLPLI